MVSNIKAIIFDWGGVCCKEAEPFASTALQQALGLSPDEITRKVENIHKEYYIGKHNRDSFWGAIIRHFNITETSEINSNALSQAYLNSYTIYQDVLEVILELRKKYTLGLLSNLTPEMRDYIRERHDLDMYFDVQVYSCDPEVQTKKPDHKIFDVIVEKLKLTPKECLFIDDASINIQAAHSIGMKTVLFKNRDQFFHDIKVILEGNG